MEAEKLNVFINSVMAFFKQIGTELTDIDTPYILDNKSPVAFDFSGIITITGPKEGCVYVSAPNAMLRSMLEVMHEPDTSISILKDLLGEIANTVSGNARAEFGSSFIISTPIVVDGIPNNSYLPKDQRSYIIPFKWQGKQAIIGICLT
ncbi:MULTISPECIES: chemotaxis protein CheX [unclassified Acinetobacter]|uniref:chemotaxis protein CheX n=1 Tax=unclassified Acinetobacter TaxID=196816 RepID=UPI0035B72446